MNVFINECVHLFSLCRGVDASHSEQSIRFGEQTKQYIAFLYQSLPLKLSHLLSAVFVCLVSITEHTTFDGLKLIWIKSGGKGRESAAKERGQAAPALHARGLLWEKELTGRRSAASSSQTTAAQKEETCWGWCDMSRSFSISLLTCLPLPFTKQTCARHACNTLSSRHSHKYVVTVVRFIRNWQGAYTHTKPSK